MNNLTKNTIAILILSLALASCEYSYDYSYQVTNKSGQGIKVHVKTLSKDSTFIVSKDSTKLLFIADHGIEGSVGPYFQDVNMDLNVFEVAMNDTSKSDRDYLKNEAWHYEKGKYSTEVTNGEFK